MASILWRLTAVAFTAGLLSGQVDQSAARVRAIEGQLAGAVSSAQRRSLESERATLLRSMMQVRPREASTLLRRTAVRANATTETPFDFSGPVMVTVADDFANGTAVFAYRFREDSGQTITAYADGGAATCGTEMHVSGWRIGDRGVVDVARATGKPATSTCANSGVQRMAVILVYGPGGTPSVATSEVYDRTFGQHEGSVAQLLAGQSYGKLRLEGSTFGWYRLPRTYGCDAFWTIRQDALAAAAKDLDPSRFDRLAIIMDESIRDGAPCFWAGQGGGCNAPVAGDPTAHYATLEIWGIQSGYDQVYVHEFGHGVGLAHSHSALYARDTIEPDRSRVSYLEYGDPYSPMGSGVAAGSYAAAHKARVGWLDPASVQPVESSGSFRLSPLDDGIGKVALRIRRYRGKDEWLWLEYQRAPVQAITLRFEMPETGAATDIVAPTRFDGQPVFTLGPGEVWSDAHGPLTIAIGQVSPDGLDATVRFDAACVSISPATPLITAGERGQSTALTASTSGGDCVWRAQSNSAWLALDDEGTRTQSATVALTISENPSADARAGSFTIGRQPVFVRQDGGSPMPRLLEVAPGGGTIPENTIFPSSIRFAQLDAIDEVQRIQLLYGVASTDDNGCSILYDINARQFRFTDRAGSGGTAFQATDFRQSSSCGAGNFSYFSTNISGQRTLAYNAFVRSAATNLYVRLQSKNGTWTAWQPGSSYTAAKQCVALFQNALDVAASGGSRWILLPAPTDCAWNASSDAVWVKLAARSGKGPATLDFTVDANSSGRDRSATITVNERKIAVRQVSVGSISSARFYPAELDLDASAASGTVFAVLDPHDAAPVVASTSPWLNVRSVDDAPIGGPNNAVSWQITLVLEPNRDTQPRLGVLQVAGYSLPVIQRGARTVFMPDRAVVGPEGGADWLSLQSASAEQTWTATTTSNWLHVGASGQGDTSFRYSVDPNTAPETRTGFILAAGALFTVTQAGSEIVVPTAYVAEPVAGVKGQGLPGAADSIFVDSPLGLAFDSRGSFYYSDGRSVVRVSTDGYAQVVAGPNYRFLDGQRSVPTTAEPRRIAVDASDRIYFIGSGGIVFRYDGAGVLTFAVGSGGGPMPIATALAFAPDGSLVFTGENRVRRMGPGGKITALAGTGEFGYSGDGGPAVAAKLNQPIGLDVGSDGTVYVADSSNNAVRVIRPDGTIDTLAGNGRTGGALLKYPVDVKAAPDGTLIIAEQNGLKRLRADAVLEAVTTSLPASSGDGGPAINAAVGNIAAIAVDLSGNVYVAQYQTSGIRQIGTDGVIRRVIGLPDVEVDGVAPNTHLVGPVSAGDDNDGNVFVADSGGTRIRRISSDGRQSVYLGSGAGSRPGEQNVLFGGISDLIVRPDGALIIADLGARRIYSYSHGRAAVVAGNGAFGAAGDGGPATSAQLEYPNCIATDEAGNIYIGDYGSMSIRKVDGKGIISTIAGGKSVSTFSGPAAAIPDGGAATSGRVNASVIALGSDGLVYFLEYGKVRRINPDGRLATLYGGATEPWPSGEPYGWSIAATPDGILIGWASAIFRHNNDATQSTMLRFSQGSVDQISATARFATPKSLHVGASGKVYVVDDSRVYAIYSRLRGLALPGQ